MNWIPRITGNRPDNNLVSPPIEWGVPDPLPGGSQTFPWPVYPGRLLRRVDFRHHAKEFNPINVDLIFFKPGGGVYLLEIDAG